MLIGQGSKGKTGRCNAPVPIAPGNAGESSDWIVVNCLPHKESVALEHLGRQAFTCYCPMIRRQVRHARRTYESVRPLFPSYVFVSLDFGRQSWRSLLSTRGVRGIVSCGEAPSTLRSDIIEQLRAREIDGAITRPTAPFRIGQRVSIVRGALDGLVATIVDLDEKDRIVVLLDLLNRPVRVSVKSESLAEVPQ